jgi:hypothetical protein
MSNALTRGLGDAGRRDTLMNTWNVHQDVPKSRCDQ